MHQNEYLWSKGVRIILPRTSFNFFANPFLNKFLDWSKLKEHADDKINKTEKLKFVLGMVENIVGKGENAGYQKAFFPGSSKKGLCGKALTLSRTSPGF